MHWGICLALSLVLVMLALAANAFIQLLLR